MRFCRAAGFVSILSTATLGCATAIHGGSQSVKVETEPPGATVVALPENVTATSPVEIELSRGTTHTLFVELDGYAPETVYVDRMTSGAVYWNILLGGLIGTAVDTDTGGAFKLEPDQVRIELKPLAGSQQPPTP